MDISEKIRQLRKQKGISQSKMAEVIGISQAAYAKIETGDTKSISIEIGKGISKALDISFNELFDIESSEDVNKLKDIVFESIFELRGNKEHFKMEELRERYGEEHWVEKGADEFMKYHGAIRDFYHGMHEALINKKFCTLDEIRNYNIKNRPPHPTDNKSQEELDNEIREYIKKSVIDNKLPYVFDNVTKEFIPKE
ncbi:MAG: helix-turn-helix transcriptional regulator [Bacteroidota bacterium]|nr:helix-turn-helix transcriptional regulator [Bacteroidota bacterium]